MRYFSADYRKLNFLKLVVDDLFIRHTFPPGKIEKKKNLHFRSVCTNFAGDFTLLERIINALCNVCT